MSFGAAFDAKEQVRQAIDIVDLVGSYVQLRRNGRNFVGLCPWHDDSRPSLQINPDRQSFKCLVCDYGGDVFSFVMRMENMEFREALELSQRALGPNNEHTRDAMSNLATTLAYEKHSDQAISMFEKVLQLASKAEGTALRDAQVQYAAGLVILGRLDPAMDHLRDAAKLGFTDTQLLTTNDDLKPLRDDPRFQALVAEIQTKQASAR